MRSCSFAPGTSTCYQPRYIISPPQSVLGSNNCKGALNGALGPKLLLIVASRPPFLLESVLTCNIISSISISISIMAPTADSQLLTVKSLGLNAPTLVSVVILFVVLVALRRRYMTAVSDIPGPFFATISIFWKLWQIIQGHPEHKIIALHKKHGSYLLSVLSSCQTAQIRFFVTDMRFYVAFTAGTFVRITHNEVSVSDPEAVDKLLLTRLRKVSGYSLPTDILGLWCLD